MPEMRLAGVRTIKEANKFFNDIFLPQHREKFAVPPQKNESAFIPLLPTLNLDDQFYMIEKRVIKNDHTFSLKNKIYDIIHNGQFYSGKEIEIRSYPNDQVRYFIDDKEVEIKNAIKSVA